MLSCMNIDKYESYENMNYDFYMFILLWHLRLMILSTIDENFYNK